MSDKLPDEVEKTLRIHVECDKPECASCSAIRLSIANAIRDAEERMRGKAVHETEWRVRLIEKRCSEAECESESRYWNAAKIEVGKLLDELRSLPLENA